MGAYFIWKKWDEYVLNLTKYAQCVFMSKYYPFFTVLNGGFECGVVKHSSEIRWFVLKEILQNLSFILQNLK